MLRKWSLVAILFWEFASIRSLFGLSNVPRLEEYGISLSLNPLAVGISAWYTNNPVWRNPAVTVRIYQKELIYEILVVGAIWDCSAEMSSRCSWACCHLNDG